MRAKIAFQITSKENGRNTTVSEVPGPLPERDRARAEQSAQNKAFVPNAKHPLLTTPPGRPRLPHPPLKLPRRPSRRSVDPPVDRATCCASDDASRSFGKNMPFTVARFLWRCRLRRPPTDEHHEAIMKRSVRFAERARTSPVRIERRAEQKEAGEFESRRRRRRIVSSSSRSFCVFASRRLGDSRVVSRVRSRARGSRERRTRDSGGFGGSGASGFGDALDLPLRVRGRERASATGGDARFQERHE